LEKSAKQKMLAGELYHAGDPELQRDQAAELGRPIKIGRNVWIGGGPIILPGITIEDNVVIGAGSVVTRNVAAGAIARGNPARVASDCDKR
jgi:maltose O-acetyltransferase